MTPGGPWRYLALHMRPIRIGMSGLLSSPGAQARPLLRRRFARDGCLRLPGFLSPPLLRLLRRGLKGVPYVRRQRGTGPEMAIVRHWTLELMVFLLNDPAFLRAAEGATGCGRIGVCIRRKVYRLQGGLEYRKGWHSDVEAGCRLVLSVNLSARPSKGGALQTRRRGSRKIAATVRARPGDALLISAEPAFEHRVTPLRGRSSRVAFATVLQDGAPYRRRVSGAGEPVPFPGRFRLPPGAACWRDGRRLLLLDAAGGAVHLGELDEARGRFRELGIPPS